MAYNEEDFLLLSGLQHFKFYRRQWALIHIESQWADNLRTVEGEILHKNAHDKTQQESRGDLYITRGMNVFSATLGVSGECDVLEWHRGQGVPLKGKEGLWMPFPIEYKKGKPNPRSGDTLQLCGQALCLEEMLCCNIDQGALYYGETKHRMPVLFTDALRQEVKDALQEMHQLIERQHTPKARPTTACTACSLNALCLPGLSKKASVTAYLSKALTD